MVVVSERVKVNVDRMDGRRGSRVALRRRGGSGVQCVQCVQCDVMCQWPGRDRGRERERDVPKCRQGKCAREGTKK